MWHQFGFGLRMVLEFYLYLLRRAALRLFPEKPCCGSGVTLFACCCLLSVVYGTFPVHSERLTVSEKFCRRGKLLGSLTLRHLFFCVWQRFYPRPCRYIRVDWCYCLFAFSVVSGKLRHVGMHRWGVFLLSGDCCASW